MSQTLLEPSEAPRGEPRPRPDSEPIRVVPHDWEWAALILIVALAAWLRLWHLDQNGTGNPYYAAAVRSMLQGWGNCFFGSFDPAGVITVDKPPGALWIQAAFAKTLGYKGLSLLLPQALMGTGSVLLTFFLTKRVFGMAAGLLSALILTVTPIGVAVDRDNLPDTALVFVLLLAAWAMSRAAETGRLRLLLVAMALVGVGFNIKMLAAFVVLPTFVFLYLAASPGSWRARLGQLAAASALLIAVSLSWSVAVELTPKSRRPYIGGSKTNSAIELALGYNGLGRVFGGAGNRRPPGGRGAQRGQGSPAGSAPGPTRESPQSGRDTPADAPGAPPPPGAFDPGGPPGPGFPDAGGPPGLGGPGPGRPPGGFGGKPGLLRFANPSISGQITWLFPLAFFGVAAASSAGSGRLKGGREAVATWLWGGWLATHWLVFSFAQGIFHEYYTVVLGPAVAILAAVGLTRLAERTRRGGWPSVLLPLALALTAAWQASLILPITGWRAWMLPAVIGGTAVSVVGSLAARWLADRWPGVGWLSGALRFGIVALLIAPTAWSLTTVLTRGNPVMPAASPAMLGAGGPVPMGPGMPGLGGNRGPGSFGLGGWAFLMNGGPGFGGFPGMPPMPGMEGEASTLKLIEFLRAHRRGEPFLIAAPSAMEVAPIIIKTGESAISLGGFMGQDKVFTKDQFVAMVEGRKLRYVLIGAGPWGGGPPGGPPRTGGPGNFGPPGGGPGSANAEILSWVREHGRVVDHDLWRMEDPADGPTPEEIHDRWRHQHGRGMRENRKAQKPPTGHDGTPRSSRPGRGELYDCRPGVETVRSTGGPRSNALGPIDPAVPESR